MNINPFSILELELWWRHPDQFKTSAESVLMLRRKLFAIYKVVVGWYPTGGFISHSGDFPTNYGIFDWLILRMLWLDVIVYALQFRLMSSQYRLLAMIYCKIYCNNLLGEIISSLLSFLKPICFFLDGFNVVLLYLLLTSFLIPKVIFGVIIAAIMLPIIVIFDAFSIAFLSTNRTDTVLDLTDDIGCFNVYVINSSYSLDIFSDLCNHVKTVKLPAMTADELCRSSSLMKMIGFLISNDNNIEIETQSFNSMSFYILTEDSLKIVNLFNVKELNIRSISDKLLIGVCQNDSVETINIVSLVDFLNLSCLNVNDENEKPCKKLVNRISPFFTKTGLKVYAENNEINQEIENELRSYSITGVGLK